MFKQSVLPSKLDRQNHGVAAMKEGDVGYVVPWAIRVSFAGNMWIMPHFTPYPYSSGTSCIQIKRTKEGVLVSERDILKYGYTFQKEAYDSRWLPVMLV